MQPGKVYIFERKIYVPVISLLKMTGFIIFQNQL